MRTITFKENTKTRLDKFLQQQLADLSRSQIQKLVKEGLIKVNKEKVLVHRFLKNGDQITIILKSKNIQKKDLPQPKVIEENNDYLIIDKPSGLIVHPGIGIKEKTLTDWLVKKYPKIKAVGDDPQRPGLVHRLDKEVSGLMVIAKNQSMFEHLKEQFKNHRVKKEYLGLVHGQVKNDTGQIDFPLSRSKLTGKIVAQPKKSEVGKEAVTEFEVLTRLVNYTYLKLKPLTGRTHQIRAHLQAYGHPLAGDKLYQNKKLKNNSALNRVFLHASQLGFFDIANNWQEYRLDLPKTLQTILNSLS